MGARAGGWGGRRGKRRGPQTVDGRRGVKIDGQKRHGEGPPGVRGAQAGPGPPPNLGWCSASRFASFAGHLSSTRSWRRPCTDCCSCTSLPPRCTDYYCPSSPPPLRSNLRLAGSPAAATLHRRAENFTPPRGAWCSSATRGLAWLLLLVWFPFFVLELPDCWSLRFGAVADRISSRVVVLLGLVHVT